MPPPFDAVVIGNVGVDTNVYVSGNEIDATVESNFTENIDYVGHAGGYTSRGYAALGYGTTFIGTLGADTSGEMVRELFAREQIDLRGLFSNPRGTARSINLVFRDGRRKNFYDGKDHLNLQPDLAFCRTLLTGARLAHVHLPNWARQILPLARELGVPIACDLQDVISIDDPYRQDFIAAADFLFFSAANQADPAPLIAELLRRNDQQIIVVGMGAQGCMLGTRHGVQHVPPVVIDLPVVDTNGAGDGLAVGFLASYVLEDRPLHESIQRGQLVARYTCAQRAPKAQLISREALERYVVITEDG